MSSSKTNLKIHLIFVTKYRKKILSGNIKELCLDIIKDELGKRKIDPIAIQIDGDDHIHIMANIKPTQSVSLIVQILKQLTTYHIWQAHPELRKHYWYRNVLWSGGYFCSTTGDASSETVQKYIDSQG